MQLAVEDLRAAGLDEQFAAIDDAIADHRSGKRDNVAVVAEPFAGRETLLDYAESQLGSGVERYSFSEIVADYDPPELEAGTAYIFDDCQYLYTRQIGGFEPLDTFLERIAMTDVLCITGWNRHAWDYLAAVRDVDLTFPIQVRIPGLSSTQITQLLTSRFGPDLPNFVETGEAGRVKSIGFDHRPVSVWRDRQVEVPVPELNPEYITFRGNSVVEEDTKAIVFERIAQLSNGNPGVATRLWDRSVRGGQIATAYVREVDQTLETDDDEAFVLELVLTNEAVSRAALADIASDVPVDRALQNLVQQNVLTVEHGGDGADDIVTMVPDHLHSAVQHLRRRRLLW